MKIIISIVAYLAICSSLFAQEDKIYAVVNGENITESTIVVALRDPRFNFETLPKEQQKEVLDKIIEQKILSQEAFKIIDPAVYKEELEKVKQKLAFQIWLKNISKTITVEDKDVKLYFDANKEKYFAPLELKASHILVKTEQEATEIIKTLSSKKDLKIAFSNIAKEKSIGPSASTGGELGWFTKDKMLVEFSEAAAALKVGEFTKKAIKTQYGFHVIYLDDKKESAPLPFESVKEKLKQELLQKAFISKVEKITTDLKAKSKIEYK